ncbi:MAG: amidohydrolase family protein [Promethearchaeota archaeon]
MIVDVHYHLIPGHYKRENAQGMVPEILKIAKVLGKKISEDLIIERCSELYGDRDGKKLIKLMDGAEIDFTVVCHVDNVDNELLTSERTQLANKRISDIAKSHPDRLISFAGIDPRRSEALDMLKQCFEEYDMKGLKYHPDNGFDPTSSESYLLLDYLEKNNGILLTHTGPLRGKRSKYSEPSLLSDILADFPNLKIIAAHMGQINWRPWAALAVMHPNLYGDLAMWGHYAIGKPELFCRELRDIIDYVGFEKVLFGSDSPIYDVILPVKDLIEKIKSLPNKAPSGIKFTQEEIDAILGGNATRLLDLE